VTSSSRKAYDAWHADLEVDREAGAPWHELVQSHLDLRRDLAGKDLLEVGCGRGGFTVWLASQPARPKSLVAADVSPVAVQKGRVFASSQGLHTIQWSVGDIQNLAHRAGSFDTIISCETVEHLHDPSRAVAELARVLRRGGRLFLTTPNYLGSMGLYRLYLRLTGRRFTEVGQPINRFTLWPRTLTWVIRAGLQITCIDGLGHYFLRRGHRPLRLFSLDRARTLTRWTALHTLVVAEKH